MGYIKKLKNNELVGGTDKTTIYPVTSTEAVFEEITNGNESSFKSQKTINKEQQDELDNHEERIQAAEAEDIKSITINGSTKKFEVDDENNVDLTIYTVDSDPEMPSIADNVGELRNVVGTSTPVLETSHKTRIETLEGGESVAGSVENKIKTKVDSINSSYQDDNNEYVKYSMTQTSGEVTNFNIDETSLKNAITSLNTSISGDNIVIRSGSTPSGTGEAGKIYRYVNSSNNTYTDYMYSGGSWVTLATHDTSNEQAQVAYYTCTATGSGAQPTKQFVGNGSLTYTPSSGGHIKILMGEANTATGTIYLQFGTTTSTKKPLYYNGESVSSDNTWEAGETIAVYYDPSANNNIGAYFASNAQGGGGKAEKIKYDNSQSGLESENVQEALDEVKGRTQIISEIDLSGYQPIGLAIKSDDNYWSSNSRTQKHILVPIVVGTTYNLRPNTTYGFVDYAWLTSNYCVANKAVPLVNGETLHITTNSVFITAPETAVYLYIRIMWDSIEYRPSYFGTYKDFVSLNNQVYELNNEVNSLENLSFKSGEIVKNTVIENYVKANSISPVTGGAVFDKFKGIMQANIVNLNSNLNSTVDRWIDGPAFSSSTTGKHAVIPVLNGYEKFYITKNSSRNAYFVFVKSYETPASAVPFNLCNGYIGRIEVSATTSQEYDIPGDCKYIIVGITNDNGTNFKPSNVSVLEYSNIEYASKISDLYTNTLRSSLDDGYTSSYSYEGDKINVHLPNKKHYYNYSKITISGIGYIMDDSTRCSQQGLAIYDKYAFVTYHRGFIRVVDMTTNTIISTFAMPEEIFGNNNHAGNANFGTTFYASGDDFPLLYVSSYQEHCCYVLRMTLESCELIQRIYLSLDSTDTIHNQTWHFYPDNDGRMIVHGDYGYYIGTIPSPSSSTAYIHLPSCSFIGTAALVSKNRLTAGCIALNGNFYMLTSSNNVYSTMLVYNYEQNRHVNTMTFPSEIQGSEFEGIAVYDGKIVVGYNATNFIVTFSF